MKTKYKYRSSHPARTPLNRVAIAVLALMVFVSGTAYISHTQAASTDAHTKSRDAAFKKFVERKLSTNKKPSKQLITAIPKDDPAYGLSYKGLRRGGIDVASTCEGAYVAEVMVKGEKKSFCSPGPDKARPNRKTVPTTTSPAMTTNPSTPLAPISPNILGTSVQCYGDGVSGRRVQALYVTTAANDKFTTVLPQIEQWAAYASQKLNESAAKTGGQRYIKWVTDASCVPDVQKVVITDADLTDIGKTASAVAAQGYNRDDRKYIMWTEGTQYCGIAFMHVDDTADPTNNSNNIYGSYARVDRQCWGYTDSTELHELTHTFGSVQPSAPNATLYGHCTDEYDLMCYDDGSNMPMRIVCTAAINETLLDCNNDDYFNTSPPAGSYLSTHWNTADSYFMFSANPTDTTAPTTPPNFYAMFVKSTSVYLSWDCSTDTQSTVMYNIYRDGNLIGRAYDTDGYAPHVFYYDSPVTPSTTYNYSVIAVDDSGNQSAPTQTVSVTTMPPDTTPPTVPGNLHVTSISPTGYAVAWDASTDTDTGLDHYWIDGTMIGPGTTTYSRSGLTPGATITVSVTATDGAGNTTDPAKATITFTLPLVDTPPTVPQTLTVIAKTDSSVTLNWSSSSDLNGMSGYTIYRDGVAIGGTASPTTTFTDKPLTTWKTYTYQVDAVDNAQQHSARSNSVTATPSPLPEPTDPSVQYAYRFWSDTYKHHFYTTSFDEAAQILKTSPSYIWRYETVAFKTSADCTNLAPVYRFWSDSYRAHFYTISTAEKDSIIATNKNWKYEGSAFCASTSLTTTFPTPIYRFWSDVYRGHFYTASGIERDTIINTNPNWRYEGVAYYVQ